MVGDRNLTKTKGTQEDDGFPRQTKPSNSYPGAFSGFYSFPSHPISVYRTGDEWPVPRGPRAQRLPREAWPIYNHPIRDVWHTLGKEVYRFLGSLGVLWTTIDPVRFAEEGGEAGPLYLWVGVKPGSLSLQVAKEAAIGCKMILAGFPDVGIAFRESIFTRSAGPQLLNSVPFVDDPIADIRSPFTSALGVPIASRSTPHSEGTGALYLCEGGQSNRVFLLTARHVLLPPSKYRNKLHEGKRTSRSCDEVLVLGGDAYPDALNDMMVKIGNEIVFVDVYKRELDALGEAVDGEDTTVSEARKIYKDKLAKAEKTIVDTNAVHSDIVKNWSTVNQRVLGHIVYAPPISVSADFKRLTEDWALIQLNYQKIDKENFKGNIIHLGNRISPSDFVHKMHPHPEGRSSFKYPVGGLLQVKGVIKEEEIRQPTLLGANGEECLIVIKDGASTGITIGRGSGTESFVREYDDYGTKSTSMQIAIHPYSHKDGAFSAPGDSGPIVVDGLGCIFGLLIGDTGGTGMADTMDVTYVTPYFWVEERIKKVFPNSCLYPSKS